jgi:hypothetical protein
MSSQTKSPWGVDVCDAYLSSMCAGAPAAHFKCPDGDGIYYFSRCGSHSGGPFWMEENSVATVSDDEWTMASVMLR